MKSIDAAMAELAQKMLNDGVSLDGATSTFEQIYIQAALKRAGGNVSAASRDLDVHRNTLHAKRRKFAFRARQFSRDFGNAAEARR